METLKKLLYEHIKDLDYHSARESKSPFKWNTPLMNEFLAFGKVVREDAQQEIEDVKKEFGRIGIEKGKALTGRERQLEARLAAVREHLDKFPQYLGRAVMYERDSDFYRKHKASCVVKHDHDKILEWLGELRRQLCTR